jgi:hypothetical protein
VLAPDGAVALLDRVARAGDEFPLERSDRFDELVESGCDSHTRLCFDAEL